MRFHELYSDLIKSKVKLKIIEFLLKHEASMSEREIASVLGISHMSVNRTMQELSEMNFVHYIAVGKAHLWKVNRQSFTYKALGQFVESLKAMPDPLSELRRVIMKYLPKPLIVKVVLFGSVAKSKETSDSDIDLFILVKNTKDQQTLENSIERLSTECLEVFGNRLAPYILTKRQYDGKKDLDVIVQLKKGIQLYPNGKVKS
ncbi:MAG: nucleotidyltransferase domain-containing protein [Candidatus Omnitrophica bacterium]|nr:nucleotidyltransferase domain-containing protein [Candidatus Omnitrophota bacterium]